MDPEEKKEDAPKKRTRKKPEKQKVRRPGSSVVVFRTDSQMKAEGGEWEPVE